MINRIVGSLKAKSLRYYYWALLYCPPLDIRQVLLSRRNRSRWNMCSLNPTMSLFEFITAEISRSTALG